MDLLRKLESTAPGRSNHVAKRERSNLVRGELQALQELFCKRGDRGDLEDRLEKSFHTGPVVDVLLVQAPAVRILVLLELERGHALGHGEHGGREIVCRSQAGSHGRSTGTGRHSAERVLCRDALQHHCRTAISRLGGYKSRTGPKPGGSGHGKPRRRRGHTCSSVCEKRHAGGLHSLVEDRRCGKKCFGHRTTVIEVFQRDGHCELNLGLLGLQTSQLLLVVGLEDAVLDVGQLTGPVVGREGVRERGKEGAVVPAVAGQSRHEQALAGAHLGGTHAV